MIMIMVIPNFRTCIYWKLSLILIVAMILSFKPEIRIIRRKRAKKDDISLLIPSLLKRCKPNVSCPIWFSQAYY